MSVVGLIIPPCAAERMEMPEPMVRGPVPLMKLVGEELPAKRIWPEPRSDCAPVKVRRVVLPVEAMDKVPLTVAPLERVSEVLLLRARLSPASMVRLLMDSDTSRVTAELPALPPSMATSKVLVLGMPPVQLAALFQLLAPPFQVLTAALDCDALRSAAAAAQAS